MGKLSRAVNSLQPQTLFKNQFREVGLAVYRERRRRELFNKKRSRKELSRRLLSIDFSLVGQEERREEEESDEEDDIYSGKYNFSVYHTIHHYSSSLFV